VALDLAEFEVRVVILELGMIYGEHRGILGRMFAEGREKHVVTVPGAGEQVWSLVHREDAADAFALACEHAAHGDRFLLSDESLNTARQIADAIARVTGATVKPWPKAEVLEKLGPYGEALLASVRVDRPAPGANWAGATPHVVHRRSRRPLPRVAEGPERAGVVGAFDSPRAAGRVGGA
jgi:nucleoside-diphosphate-sugar epimerase